jgi:hypothetical protein
MRECRTYGRLPGTRFQRNQFVMVTVWGHHDLGEGGRGEGHQSHRRRRQNRLRADTSCRESPFGGAGIREAVRSPVGARSAR